MTSGTMALIRKGDEFFSFLDLFHRFPLNAENVFAVFFALVTIHAVSCFWQDGIDETGIISCLPGRVSQLTNV